MSDEQASDGGVHSATASVKVAAEEAAIEIVQADAAREARLPEKLRHLPERERALELELKQSFAEQEHALRERYATWILVVLAGQFLISDAVFVAYAWAGESWEIPAGVIQGWLAAMVIQIVGVAHVVTRHLFPSRDGLEPRARGKFK